MQIIKPRKKYLTPVQLHVIYIKRFTTSVPNQKEVTVLSGTVSRRTNWVNANRMNDDVNRWRCYQCCLHSSCSGASRARYCSTRSSSPTRCKTNTILHIFLLKQRYSTIIHQIRARDVPHLSEPNTQFPFTASHVGKLFRARSHCGRSTKSDLNAANLRALTHSSAL